MRRPHPWLIGLVVVLFLAILLVPRPKSTVPVWQGRSLDYWFELSRTSPERAKLGDRPFLETGSNAVPFVVDRLPLKDCRPEPACWHWPPKPKWPPLEI